MFETAYTLIFELRHGDETRNDRREADAVTSPRAEKELIATVRNRTRAVIERDTLKQMYREMYTIRYYNERLKEVYDTEGGIPSGIHGSMGQEAPAVGVCRHLRGDDWAFATHRSSHVAIAKGMDLESLIAEQLGKEGGVSDGKAGEQHLLDDEVNFVSGAIVAQHLPSATGVALTHKRRGNGNVVVGFIGDGAANQGAFYECMNFASVHDLPLVFVIEDNAYGISTPKDRVTAVEDNSKRAFGQGMPGRRIEGNDAVTVYEEAGAAIERARDGEGPTLLEVETYRLQGHFYEDPEQYRHESEVETMRADDCMPKIARATRESGVDDDEIDGIQSEIEERVDAAIRYAQEQPYPSPETATQNVFVADDGGGA